VKMEIRSDDRDSPAMPNKLTPELEVARAASVLGQRSKLIDP